MSASSRQLIDPGDFLIETANDSDGEIISTFRTVVHDKGRAWIQVAGRDPKTVAEIVFDAFTEDEYGVLDEVSAVFDRQIGLTRGGTRPPAPVHDGNCGAKDICAIIVSNWREPSGESGLDVSVFFERRKILLAGWVDVRVDKGCLAGFISKLLEQAEEEQVF